MSFVVVAGKKELEVKIASLYNLRLYCKHQAARPKVLISPLQTELGVALHHLTGSRYLVEHLHRLFFSSSYNEVKLFELSAALSQGTDLAGVSPSSWIQFIGDNVDHQVRTLDGACLLYTSDAADES